MPLPLLIPIGIGIAAAAAGGGLTLNAQGKIKKAKAEAQAAYNAYQAKHNSYQAYHAGTEKQLQDLGRVRAAGMQTVRDAIDFIQRAKLLNPDIISDAEITREGLDQIDQAYGDILKTLGGVGSSIGAGVGVGALTALGAYGLVGALGTASTGAAIGGLSGAAAGSATLAWLGGGALAAGGLGIAGGTAVLGGIVTAPALIAFGAFRQFKAGKVQKEAAEKIRQIRVKEAEIARARAKLQATRQRCDEVGRTVRELTEQLKVALNGAFPDREKDVYRVVQIAKALRAAIDEPVIPTAPAATRVPAPNAQHKNVGRRTCPRCGEVATLYRLDNPRRLRCLICRDRG